MLINGDHFQQSPICRLPQSDSSPNRGKNAGTVTVDPNQCRTLGCKDLNSPVIRGGLQVVSAPPTLTGADKIITASDADGGGGGGFHDRVRVGWGLDNCITDWGGIAAPQILRFHYDLEERSDAEVGVRPCFRRFLKRSVKVISESGGIYDQIDLTEPVGDPVAGIARQKILDPGFNGFHDRGGGGGVHRWRRRLTYSV